MWFESIVLLAAEPFSIYLRFLESLIALGRPHQSLTFCIREDRKARFSQIVVDLLVRKERQHVSQHLNTMFEINIKVYFNG